MITVITDLARGEERKKGRKRKREINIARLYAKIHRHVGEA
jgi:hypothetical protein